MSGHVIEIVYGSKTDKPLAVAIAIYSPRANKAGKKALLAIDRLLKRKGFFSNDQKRLKRVYEAMVRLHRALEEDGYIDVPAGGGDGNPYHDRMSSFLCTFARAYPNWQPEYEYLNRLLPEFYLFLDKEFPPPDLSGEGVEIRSVLWNQVDPRGMCVVACPSCKADMRVRAGRATTIICRGCRTKSKWKVRTMG